MSQKLVIMRQKKEGDGPQVVFVERVAKVNAEPADWHESRMYNEHRVSILEMGNETQTARS
jgi:hypothetical protein